MLYYLLSGYGNRAVYALVERTTHCLLLRLTRQVIATHVKSSTIARVCLCGQSREHSVITYLLDPCVVYPADMPPVRDEVERRGS